MTFRSLTASSAALFLATTSSAIADGVDVSDWASVEKAAEGQTVYFNAWGGSEQINDYIAWAGDTLEKTYGVKLIHVKLEDTASAVSSVVAEKAAGREANGSIDLIWINGENFASMKEQQLLFAPDWTTQLPNWQYVDHETKPTITVDFTIPTDGLEAPWGMAKLVFFHDSARTSVDDMPDSAEELLSWAENNPGRFTYPQPPNFIGSSFLKQVLIETVDDASVLQEPVVDADFADVTAPLFAYLDQLHPNLWRSARAFPKDYPSMTQLLADGELDITFAFNPAEASNAIQNQLLPDSVRSFTFSVGTLSNTHFLTIPFNANSKEAALVTANFLMSPEAQLRKQDVSVWGDPTVLAMDKLPEEQRAQFAALDLGVATLTPDQLGPSLLEPHASWLTRIETEWAKRYGVAN
ncbi:MAG: ABC transporter substrate-binding protein [Pseudomonadota bacterium]